MSGSTVYTCMLNQHGGVEADLTVSAIGPGSGTAVHDPAFQGNIQLLKTTRKYVSKSDIAVRNRNHHAATGNHMPYLITQCYLPPSSGDFPIFTPAEAGTRFSDHGGMQD